MKPIWIIAARRTPQGRFLGALSKFSAIDLAVIAGKAVLADVKKIDPTQIDSVIVGNVLGAGLGMNIARQIGVGADLSFGTPAFTINMMCASGMQAIRLAAQAIQNDDAQMVLCGGTESMSNAPYLLDRARSGYKLGDGVLKDSILSDGLTDAFIKMHMGLTAERLVELYKISREEQDTFAAQSQQRYAAAHMAGYFCDEIVPVEHLKEDEPPRIDTTVAALSKLKPVFKADGTVTAGNASGINDGAAMLLLCGEAYGRRLGLEPLTVITASATAGCEPSLMGLGPVHAIKKISNDANEFDIVELNEAFAAQSLACIRELKLDGAKVNPDGGAIAVGHPIGASGARLLVHLAHRRSKRGLAALCVGGGMGCAMIVERP